jgi:P4 family phage/plasmid primase-like protien
MATSKHKFLDSFPDHVYRYIDQTGSGRAPISSDVLRPDLNKQGYEAYFTVNGFKGAIDAKKEHCSSINAFFVDIDGRKDPAEIEQIMDRLTPTFVLETKNGYHVYWLLDEIIYKEDLTPEAWDVAVLRWERIEQSIVSTLNADPVVKDITRIMRQPGTYYWKKSGDAWKNGVKDVFKIKGIHKNISANYTMEEMENAFPIVESTVAPFPKTAQGEQMQRFAESERKGFFEMVNKEYPIEERPSFKKLISGAPDTLPPTIASRNMALLITATLMRQAGWPQKKALDHVLEVGWHGIENEPGGKTEIANTINSAYRGNYSYSYKNDVIAYNMTPEEQMEIQAAYTAVAKKRKDTDKVRFSNYEYEVRSRYPYIKKNEIGIFFNYENGVYRMLSDQDVSNIILNMLYDDMLWGYRTKRNVSDKVACLLSIIPDLEITNDQGDFFNCRNGLLQLSTGELKPHTPDFVSLIQSPVVYDPSATSPTWEACLDAWMKGPEAEQKRTLLQQYAGYLLTSNMAYSKALFLVGDGGNGKSTFADTISMVIGKQGTSRIDLEDLYSTFGLKGLIGKRLNIVEEVGGNYYQAHKLKKLVSGESLTINMKFKDQFEFTPEAKFIFAVNTMPRVDDSSSATERRICIVHFNNNFRDMPNTDLRFAGGLLAQELPGILNWMLEGYRMLMKEKRFVITNEQLSALSEYREENSSVDGFIGEALEFGKGPGYVSSTSKLYGDYKDYCIKDGRKYKSMIAFAKELKAYGKRTGKFTFVERTNGHSTGFFNGVKVASKWDDQNFNDVSGGVSSPMYSPYYNSSDDDDVL